MVSIDPVLRGKVVHLRPSQVKFESNSCELDSEFFLLRDTHSPKSLTNPSLSLSCVVQSPTRSENHFHVT